MNCGAGCYGSTWRSRLLPSRLLSFKSGHVGVIGLHRTKPHTRSILFLPTPQHQATICSEIAESTRRMARPRYSPRSTGMRRTAG